MTLKEDQIKNILAYCQLQYEPEKKLKEYLKEKYVQTLPIRTLLCQENTPSNQGYYLLEGRLSLFTTANNEKIAVSEITTNKFVNLELPFNDWKCKYSISVASTFIKYIPIEQDYLIPIANSRESEIQSSLKFREAIVRQKSKKITEEQKKRKIQTQIDKLVLPYIHLHQNDRPPTIINHPKDKIRKNSKQTEFEEISKIPVFSKYLKTNKDASLKMLPFHSAQTFPETEEQKILKSTSQQILDQYHQSKQKSVEGILSNSRSLTLQAKQHSVIDYSRNEKLFKQHLKHIVRRKLLFERKHFKILKKLNNFNPQSEDINNNLPQPDVYNQKDKNPIDNYFDF